MASFFGYFIIFGFLLTFLSVVSPQADLSTIEALQNELLVPGWNHGSLSFCSWPGLQCNSKGAVEKLELPHCQLRGNISTISLLKSLKWLDLSNNFFHGQIPSAFGNLSELEYLDLSANKFDGLIPAQLGSIRNLRSLNLSNNFLTGAIPNELQNLEKLEELQVAANELTGSIPGWVGNLSNLRVFVAYENLLSGRIPGNLGEISKLEVLNLHSNGLDGDIPKGIFASGKLGVLVLTMNNLNGSIPELIGDCQGLSNVRIGNNRLGGSIPASIGKISSLTYFEADVNDLSGEIVPVFAQCSNLTLLNLAFNDFSGTIPIQLGGLANLQELILSRNKLIGEIPKPILQCKNLAKLDLTGNRINGTIPEDLCNISRLQFLLLGDNFIRGKIPPEIGNCLRLLDLQLGGNELTGNIPPQIGKIWNLQISLNLSFNHLSGPIPREFGKLDKLVTLDLSNNQLSGSIPLELRGMLSLISVDFSNNLLTGQIPVFPPFQKSPSSSFLGNKKLCGDPLSSCGNSVVSSRHNFSFKITMALISSGFLVSVIVTLIALLFMRKERQEMAGKDESVLIDVTAKAPSIVASDVFIENLKQAVDFDYAISATLKDSNEISCGTFSIVYKAVMPSGLVLSVKKLKSMDRAVLHHQIKMIRELERLGKLCHKNLLRLIGFVIYEDAALLMHDFFPNGTLAQLLHGVSKAETEPNWPGRLSMAVGIAEGIAFLHHLAIIHLDISSANIFLDANCNPLIGEIEISKLLDPSKGTASISAVAGSFGYIPPEYAYTMQVTAPGNVYSYGVVLLEILTTRLPVDEGFGEELDLVKWVHNAPARGETPEQILDSRLSTFSFAWRRQMLAVLKVALLCTDTTPAKRPKMKKVVDMLLDAKRK